MITVWRIEHPKSHMGPYTSPTPWDSGGYGYIGRLPPETPNHPCIVEDCGFHYTRWPHGLVVGCKSLEDLCYWFAGAVRVLDECGFVLREYQVDLKDIHYGKSGIQLAFFPPADNGIEHSVWKMLDGFD